MILIQYIVKKVFKNQLIILVLLCLVCICQKLIKILGSDHILSIHFIVLYLILNIPELNKLLIPFSLFLSVIITYYQLHIHNEILAMYSCGINKNILTQAILLYSTVVSCIAFINLSWICPYCEQYQNNILLELKKNIHLNIYTERQFQSILNKHLILFASHVNNKKLQNIFIVNKKKNGHNKITNIITADQGSIHNDSNDFQSIILNTGTYYKIHKNKETYTNICITDFSKNHILINYNTKLSQKNHRTVNHMFINQLWNSSSLESHIELNWRLTLITSILMMPILGLLLINDISHRYLLNFLLSMILYIVFFVLHVAIRSYSISSFTNSTIWIWLINFIYFVIILLINFKEKIFFKKIFKRNF